MGRPKTEYQARFLLTLTEEQLEWVRETALGKGMSAAELIRYCIDFYSVNMPQEDKDDIQLRFERIVQGARRPGSVVEGIASPETGHKTADNLKGSGGKRSR